MESYTMPRRKTHVEVGALIGVLAGAYVGRDEKSGYNVATILGGFVGGIAGGRLPDILEPPINPRHRSVAHAIVPVGSAGMAMYEKYRRQIAECIRCSNAPMELGADGINWHKIWNLFLAGLLAGLAAGYVSHLILDGITTFSLPVLG